MTPDIQAGAPLGSRYRLIKDLGQGGFGHTYLAEDTYRFNELCVLKEFVPQVEGAAALQKAQQLFEREAGVLYQLQHPQIPKFRELLRVESGTLGRLFLVQDYVEGPTYLDLLNTRRGYGGCFTEVEVKQLFHHLLPVLDYIHSVGVVHRDISPDNIILRNVDGLPVLIDFGGVKKLVANVNYQLTHTLPGAQPSPAVTRLGKVGYAPEEQLSAGEATPASDFYALAATALVLLSGQDPYDLYDRRNQAWNWRPQVTLSPRFGEVLDRMLAARPSDRFQSAAELMQALGLSSPAVGLMSSDPGAGHRGTPPTAATVAVSPANPVPPSATPAPVGYTPIGYDPSSSDRSEEFSQYPVTPVTGRPSSSGGGFLQAIVGLIVLVGAIGLVVWVAGQWQPAGVGDRTEDTTEDSTLSAEEQARKQALRERRENLGVSREYFVPLIDQIFFSRYPDRQGTTLTDSPEDAELRLRWDTIAAEMLDTLEQNLSTPARQNLGRYGAGDREQWQTRVNALYVSSRALNDLADAKFLALFPDQATENFIDQPMGQVWHGIAEDQVRAMEAGERLSELVFESGAFRTQANGRLDPGQGMVYVLNLSEGQLMRINLQVPSEATQLSLYLPRPNDETPFLLADSAETTWSGRLNQSGYYEIVVVVYCNATNCLQPNSCS